MTERDITDIPGFDGPQELGADPTNEYGLTSFSIDDDFSTASANNASDGAESATGEPSLFRQTSPSDPYGDRLPEVYSHLKVIQTLGIFEGSVVGDAEISLGRFIVEYTNLIKSEGNPAELKKLVSFAPNESLRNGRKLLARSRKFARGSIAQFRRAFLRDEPLLDPSSNISRAWLKDIELKTSFYREQITDPSVERSQEIAQENSAEVNDLQLGSVEPQSSKLEEGPERGQDRRDPYLSMPPAIISGQTQYANLNEEVDNGYLFNLVSEAFSPGDIAVIESILAELRAIRSKMESLGLNTTEITKDITAIAGLLEKIEYMLEVSRMNHHRVGVDLGDRNLAQPLVR